MPPAQLEFAFLNSRRRFHPLPGRSKLWLPANSHIRAQDSDEEIAEDRMKRAQIPRILLLALLASAAAWAAPAADQRAGAAPALVSGVYWVTFSVNPDPAMAAGGVIACKARMAPNLAAFEDPNPGVAPVESAAGTVKLVGSGRAGSPVLCLVEIPSPGR
jgi:hypothetical protein